MQGTVSTFTLVVLASLGVICIASAVAWSTVVTFV
jgi:hypothetical protein